MRVDREIGGLAGYVEDALSARRQRARREGEADRRAVLRAIERQREVQRAEIRQRGEPGQHAAGRLVQVHLRGEVVAGDRGIGGVDAGTVEIAEDEMRLPLVVARDLGGAGQPDIDGRGLRDGGGERDPVHRQLLEKHPDRQRRNRGADRPGGGRWLRRGRGRRQPRHGQGIGMQLVDHHAPMEQRQQRQP
jgi:hypothetical protein